jgi:hypothetical protein
LIPPWTVNNQQTGDQWEVSTARLFKGESSDRFAVLYRHQNQDVEWQAIEFNGDTQSLTAEKTVFTQSTFIGRTSRQLNMDCLGKVTGSREKGICAVTFTYKQSLASNSKIKIQFMDEEGENPI